MGIEFIRSRGGKPYEKRWADGLGRTKIPQLLGVEIAGERRTVTAVLTSGGAPKIGTTVLIQNSNNNELDVCDGLLTIARVRAPPSSLISDVAQHHGIAKAVVQGVSVLGHTIELELP